MAKRETKSFKNKESAHRSKIKKERENRLRSKQKQSQKKRLNQELFDVVKKENIDSLDNESKMKVINDLYNLIISFPEENHDKINLLLEFLQDKNLKIIMKTMKLVKNLFVDVMPSYRIRLDGEDKSKSKGNNKSMEVESLQSFERSLLKYYEKFIKILSIFLRTFSSSKKSSSKESISKLLQFIVDIISQLFEKFYLFNYSDDLYKILVEKLFDGNPGIRKRSFEALAKILSLQDNSGTVFDLKYAIIKLIGHFLFIKPHDKFDTNVLDLFTCHKIEFPDYKKENDELAKLADIKFGAKSKLEVVDSDYKTKKQMQIEKKEKKNLMREKEKIIKGLRKEMSEYENTSNSKMIFNMNLKILKKILLVFLDILKFKKDSPLIRSVLSGIGILCENINVEILLDLQKCIYEFVNYSLTQDKNQEMKIFAVTALKSCLNITEKLTKDIISLEDSNLINSTFFFLSKIAADNTCKKMTKDDLFTLLEILDALLLKNRQYSLDTVCAFIKRLTMFTQKLNVSFVSAFLLILKRIFQKYPSVSTMRDSDEDFFDLSIMTDPSICNGKQSNIHKEIEGINKTYGKESKMVKKLVEYLKKDEKINPQLASLSFYEILLAAKE